MDTKSRKYNKVGYSGYCIICCLVVVLITISLLSGSIFAATEDMQWIDGYETMDHYYFGEITDAARHEAIMNISGWVMLGTGVAAVAGLIAALVMTGRFVTDEEGKPDLNWFDRIWSEVHLAGGIAAGTLAGAMLEIYYQFWMQGMYLKIWNWYNNYDLSESLAPNVEFVFLLIMQALAVGTALACLITLCKKLKAREFWEKSLLGGIYFMIVRGIKNSSNTLFKVVIILIIGAFLCSTWIGLPVVLVLIVYYVPKICKQFDEIKTGVTEVKNGNLEYKIPVNCDAKGFKSDLGRLASDINDISQASNIAIQNELKSQRLKTDLISNVSHDLKTPLTSMISYVGLIKQEGLDSPNAPEYLDIIDQKTQRLKTLTEDLFEAAKASSGAVPVNMEDIDLSSLITQTLVEMEETLEARNLQVHVKNLCEDTHIRADGQLLWRVLENLMGNIAKYALEGSRVYINLSEHMLRGSEQILLEIKNVSKDELNISADELMERFKRGDESRTTEGSGLGLAIAKDLVKMMNGVFEISIDGDLFKASVMMEKAKLTASADKEDTESTDSTESTESTEE
ncbi:MAG: HAMP domain-containing sensor histidine kinase [Firmicutes bacterium]|nr:HAMP domain-containing sensor histidine kinase [Bacillota bacterium]